MISDERIPLVVGVTAHRAVRPQDEDALRTAVTAELKKLRSRCPHVPMLMLTSLAEGGDLLCAEAAMDLDIPLRVVLPVDRIVHEQDLSEEGRRRFRRCCAAADQVFVAPFTEAVPSGGPDRSFRFRQAGIFVSSHCHVLLALWDGGPGTEAACGTAEAVEFALYGGYRPAEGEGPVAGHTAVLHVFTPREKRSRGSAGTVRLLGDGAALNEALDRTEEFDLLASRVSGNSRSVLPPHEDTDPTLDHLERVRSAAAALSAGHARRYRRVLALLAVTGALFAASFLLYDEAQVIWLILVCGALLLTAGAALAYANRSACHRRYIEYRALAEALRVQIFLRYAGTGVQAANLLPWTQRQETGWIPLALSALSAGPAQKTAHDVRTYWVEDQRGYHESALKRSRRSQTVSDRVVGCALVVSIILYLAAVVFELLCGGVLQPAVLPAPDPEFWRTVLKIALGLLSAVTLLIAGYYGHLSLPRLSDDHGKMERFYAAMSERLAREGQTDTLLTRIAREELIESGNWCSYQKDNAPDIDI